MQIIFKKSKKSNIFLFSFLVIVSFFMTNIFANPVYSSVYKIYSERNTTGAEIVDTVSGADQLTIQWWYWTLGKLSTELQSTWDKFSEGGVSLKAEPDNSGGIPHTALAYCYFTTKDGGNNYINLNKKDLSSYSYLAFDINYSTNTMKLEVMSNSVNSNSSNDVKRNTTVLINDNTWDTVILNTSVFSGIDFSNVIALNFQPQVSYLYEPVVYYLDNIVFFNDLATTIDISPSNIIVPSGLRKVFYADPKDGSNEDSGCYVPDWKVAGSLDSNSIVSSTYNIREIFFEGETTGSSVSGQIQTSTNNFTTTYQTNVTVSSVTWQSFYPFYKDTGLNSTIGLASAINSEITASTESITGTIGDNSLRVDYSVRVSSYADDLGWASVFFEAPIALDMTPDFSAMTSVLSFRIKTSTDMFISMRSDNISEGKETSKFKLSDYIDNITDNNWHEVKILVDNFKQRDQNLDFTQMKIPFALTLAPNYEPDIASSENRTGTFYLDDIKLASVNSITPSFTTALKLIGTNVSTNTIGWTAPSLPANWESSVAYIQLDVEAYSENWAIQLYTDNEESDANPKYTGTGDPVGLVAVDTGTVTLPLCWRVTDSTQSVGNLSIAEIVDGSTVHLSTSAGNPYYPWLWMKDKNTPDDINTSGQDETFVNGEEYVRVIDSNLGIQHVEGTFSGATSPIYVYIGVNFKTAATPRTYSTNKITLELFTE